MLMFVDFGEGVLMERLMIMLTLGGVSKNVIFCFKSGIHLIFSSTMVLFESGLDGQR